MSEYEIYFAPGACSRVSLIAFEKAGITVKKHLIRFDKDENKSPEYRAINPQGKVPYLLVDGVPLAENVAIIQYLNNKYPDAEILPKTDDPLIKAQQIADLVFCSATLHPIVTRIRRPSYFCSPENYQDVQTYATSMMRRFYNIIEERLSKSKFWYGDEFSIIDAYFNWTLSVISTADFDSSDFPNIQRHNDEIKKVECVKKILEEEKNIFNQLNIQVKKIT